MDSRSSTRRVTHQKTRHRSSTTTHRSNPRRHISILEGAIIAACTLAVMLTFSRAIAAPVPRDIQATTVRVEASQTLWSLAGEHPIDGMSTAQTVEYIQRINDRTDSALRVGEVVLVPQAQDGSTALASR